MESRLQPAPLKEPAKAGTPTSAEPAALHSPQTLRGFRMRRGETFPDDSISTFDDCGIPFSSKKFSAVGADRAAAGRAVTEWMIQSVKFDSVDGANSTGLRNFDTGISG